MQGCASVRRCICKGGTTVPGQRIHAKLAPWFATLVAFVLAGTTAGLPANADANANTGATTTVPGAVAPAGLSPDQRVGGLWYTNPDSLTTIRDASPTLGDALLNRRDSFEWLGSVPDGWSTTPYVNYGSYARFAADIEAGTPPDVPVLMYDPEKWDRNLADSDLRAGAASDDLDRILTPDDEQRHPAKYMKLFGQAAHGLGYRVITAPGVNLVDVQGADCVRQSGEGAIHAYLRCRLAANAAVESDEIDVQFQSEECNEWTYSRDVTLAQRQARQANPDVHVLSGLSTGWCSPTGEDLLAAHRAVQNVTVGHFFAIFPKGIRSAVDFVGMMAPVKVGSTGYAPADDVTLQGTAPMWRISGDSQGKHSITDRSGLHLFDSGLRPPGSTFRHRFAGSGTYRATDTATGDSGTISIPVIATPRTGKVATVFTIRTSSVAAPAGYFYATQIQRPGSTEWKAWKTGAVNPFVADAGPGTYSFQARLQRKENGATSEWSPPASIVVS